MNNPVWFDPIKLPSQEECCLRAILDRHAMQRPDVIFALFEDGTNWTYAETLDHSRRCAAALQALGAQPGDVVLSWLPNGPAHLRTWFGINYLGAVHSPLNVAYRGALLAHAIQVSGAKILVAHASLVSRLSEIETSCLETIVVIGGEASQIGELRVLEENALEQDASSLRVDAPVEPWDRALLLFTSGTTGPSKGVWAPYAQLWTIGRAHFGFLSAEDRMFLMTPLNHIGPISGVVGALIHDASVVVVERFRTSDFWQKIRATGSTAVPGMGPAIVQFLLKAPPQPDDAENPLRIVNVTSVSEATMAFGRRFNVDYFASFSMSETSVVLISEPNSKVVGSCGRPRTGVQVRLVDDHDVEVPIGAIGEITVRADIPWTICAGYDKPDATARAWRNGWFHTGDAARRDQDGNFYFVDRLKDAIRRRGENMSSLEIEREVRAHPAVEDAAAIGVRDASGDEEVMVVITVLPGERIEPRELISFLAPRMPHYMVPRYVRVVPEMPKTSSNKIQKAELRAAGLTETTWDREAEGLTLRGERLAAKVN